MRVTSVPLGAKGFDTVEPLTNASAASLRAEGATYVVRYLGGITGDEANAILGAGLGLQLVTYSGAVGWMPSAELGESQGQEDLVHLGALGVPAGALVWIDLEGAGADPTSWVNARSEKLVEKGYVVGLYVGAGCVLDGEKLYALPYVTRYWRAFNAGIPEPQCGFCQWQLFPPNQSVQGVEVDFDFSGEDYEGRKALMLVA